MWSEEWRTVYHAPNREWSLHVIIILVVFLKVIAGKKSKKGYVSLPPPPTWSRKLDKQGTGAKRLNPRAGPTLEGLNPPPPRALDGSPPTPEEAEFPPLYSITPCDPSSTRAGAPWTERGEQLLIV